jgi:hypothetical protein
LKVRPAFGQDSGMNRMNKGIKKIGDPGIGLFAGQEARYGPGIPY